VYNFKIPFRIDVIPKEHSLPVRQGLNKFCRFSTGTNGCWLLVAGFWFLVFCIYFLVQTM
jgi:uncharacterized membrane protein YccF (DUF307 family)